MTSRNNTIMQRLSQPQYETTKGLTPDERKKFLSAVASTRKDKIMLKMGLPAYKPPMKNMMPNRRQLSFPNTATCIQNYVEPCSTLPSPEINNHEYSSSATLGLQPNELDTTRDSSAANSNAMEQQSQENEVPGRTIKSKQNWCKYCGSLQTKIGRHMAVKHKDIPDVQQYLQISDPDVQKQKKKRRELCKMLINNSNNVFNQNVIDDKVIGKPIPVKQTKINPSKLSHVVCSYCGGLYSRKYFSCHKITCIQRQNLYKNELNEKPLTSSLLCPTLDKKYRILQKNVFTKMAKDKISLIAQTDPLILEFGRRFLKGHMADKQRNYVSNKVRTLADLLIRLKKVDPTNVKTMSDCVDPTNFNILCDIVRKWSAYNEENGVCNKGSVPRRIFKSLKLCSQVLWSEAIKNKNLTIEEQHKIRSKHEKFMNLMESDWGVEVNSAADKSLKIKKVSKEDKMPLAEDIALYFKHMTSKIENLTANLKEKHEINEYNNLTKAVLAYLIVFNSRRPSEVTYATKENYTTLKQKSSENVNEILGVFTVAATKNDCKVPIIVSNIALRAINTLLDHRSVLNIKGNLLFGKDDGAAYNGSDLIFKFKSEISLQKPKDFTANGLRHYWATVSQLDPQIKKYMPKFLGHTTATHEKFYEMPMSDIHLSIIGPSLLQHCLPGVSTKDARSFQDAINFESEANDPGSSHQIHITNADEDTESICDRTLRTRQMKSTNSKTKVTVRSNSMSEDCLDDLSDDSDFDVTNFCNTPKKNKIFRPKNTLLQEDSSNDSENDSTTSPLGIQPRNRWTTPEKHELCKSLPRTILGLERPGRGKIKKAWESSKIIKKRHSLQMTRIEVSKYFTKKKTVSTPEKNTILNSLKGK